MVKDQVLARHAQIHRVPILEFASHVEDQIFAQRRFGQVECVDIRATKHRIKHLRRQIIGLDRVTTGITIHATILQERRYSVVRHINGRVGQRLNHPTFIPRQFSAETKLARTCPRMQPIDGRHKRVLALCIVALEAIRNVLFDCALPFILFAVRLVWILNAILQKPLIAVRHHTFIASARHDSFLGFPVHIRESLTHQLSLTFLLGHAHFLAGKITDKHDALREAILVHQQFDLLQLVGVLL
mmetsp:Transcript_40334/g.66251  ORF Transcript_40334/g.66251 Transcript_40334/m.66251 type:complete len:243 (-) Transcript_40334:870-1598(-)